MLTIVDNANHLARDGVDVHVVPVVLERDIKPPAEPQADLAVLLGLVVDEPRLDLGLPARPVALDVRHIANDLGGRLGVRIRARERDVMPALHRAEYSVGAMRAERLAVRLGQQVGEDERERLARAVHARLVERRVLVVPRRAGERSRDLRVARGGGESHFGLTQRADVLLEVAAVVLAVRLDVRRGLGVDPSVRCVRTTNVRLDKADAGLAKECIANGGQTDAEALTKPAGLFERVLLGVLGCLVLLEERLGGGAERRARGRLDRARCGSRAGEKLRAWA